ncbi:MAG: hypothetical protein KAJ33_01410 [Thermoplasmata archaeon]|nr:hypothetical protein [Thermoplasmata archaeon]
MKTMFWYLGFLSILSVLFFIEWEPGFLGFLGFIPYFSTYNMSDERIEINIGRASRNAFMFSTFFGSLTLAYGYISGDTDILLPAFVILFGGGLLICLLSLFYYDQMGQKK